MHILDSTNPTHFLKCASLVVFYQTVYREYRDKKNIDLMALDNQMMPTIHKHCFTGNYFIDSYETIYTLCNLIRSHG